ncbi:MAG: hypothetical protein ABIA47_00525 [bacterium]
MTNGDVSTSEILDFLQQNMLMREDVENIVAEVADKKLIPIEAKILSHEDVEGLVDTRLKETESRILTEFDRFCKLHETLDQELLMMRHRQDRLEERLNIVEQKVGLATS